MWTRKSFTSHSWKIDVLVIQVLAFARPFFIELQTIFCPHMILNAIHFFYVSLYFPIAIIDFSCYLSKVYLETFSLQMNLGMLCQFYSFIMSQNHQLFPVIDKVSINKPNMTPIMPNMPLCPWALQQENSLVLPREVLSSRQCSDFPRISWSSSIALQGGGVSFLKSWRVSEVVDSYPQTSRWLGELWAAFPLLPKQSPWIML